jgi:excisionase family DNA binding protein
MTLIGRPIRQKKLYDINEIAEYLNTTKGYVYKLTSLQRIPHIKMGKKLLFDLKDINRWLDSKKSGVK